jgi:hypothetical protein
MPSIQTFELSRKLAMPWQRRLLQRARDRPAPTCGPGYVLAARFSLRRLSGVADLRGLLESADGLRVDAIAQDPFCAQPDRADPRSTYIEARERGFDNLPVRDSDGRIRRVVPTSALANATDWEFLKLAANPLSTDQLVARDAPAFSLLERLAHEGTDLLFCLGRDGVDGLVTVYDLNQPAAHLLGFGLVLICEAELARVLREGLGEDPSTAKKRAEAVIGKGRMGVRRWERAREADIEVHLSSALTFGEKCELLPAYGLGELSARLRVDGKWLMAELWEIKALRDALAHYDDEDRLADPVWVHERMHRTHSLAHRIVGTSD